MIRIDFSQLHQAREDAAAAMPSIAGKKILMGFWHNWPAGAADGYQQGSFANIALEDVPSEYNVVAVAFMKGRGIPTFQPYNLSDAEFRRQVGVLNAQGRAVLISLGGADAHIELHAGQEQALAAEIVRLVETYGFDGLDIDLEQSAIDLADNQRVLPAALKLVREHYAGQGKHFIVSMAPEFPYLHKNGKYVPYLQALEGVYDFIAPQYYNQGGDGLWVQEANGGKGAWIAQNNDAMKEDFLYYLTESLATGSRDFVRIPAQRLAIGLPSNVDAAATGYVINPAAVSNAFRRLEAAGHAIKGLMTWSVNWDDGLNKRGERYNWEFRKRYASLIHDGEGGDQRPAAPQGLRLLERGETSLVLAWNASSGQRPIDYYSLYRDGRRAGFHRQRPDGGHPLQLFRHRHRYPGQPVAAQRRPGGQHQRRGGGSAIPAVAGEPGLPGRRWGDLRGAALSLPAGAHLQQRLDAAGSLHPLAAAALRGGPVRAAGRPFGRREPRTGRRPIHMRFRYFRLIVHGVYHHGITCYNKCPSHSDERIRPWANCSRFLPCRCTASSRSCCAGASSTASTRRSAACLRRTSWARPSTSAASPCARRSATCRRKG